MKNLLSTRRSFGYFYASVENQVNVAHYISELLFQHDCVVVPGFGAFVSTYASAKVHPAQHTFSPPSKQIVFNKHLQQNDGLLAQTIANETPCAFDEAMKGVVKFVDELNSQLKAGKKVELHNLGTLSFDPEKNISFESFPEINYLIDSFGLGSFQSMPILREAGKEKEVVERKPIVHVDRPVAEELVVAKPVRRRGRGVLITSAILLPLFVAAFWFTSQNPNGLAGLGLFGKVENSKYHSTNWFSKLKENSIPSNELKADSNGIAEISLADNAPAIIVDIHKVAADSTRVAASGAVQGDRMNSTSSEKRYYVIGGCFSVPENAANFLKSLKAKGFDPAVIDHVRSKLIHIALASFGSQKEAENFAATVNANVPGVWILKK